MTPTAAVTLYPPLFFGHLVHMNLRRPTEHVSNAILARDDHSPGSSQIIVPSDVTIRRNLGSNTSRTPLPPLSAQEFLEIITIMVIAIRVSTFNSRVDCTRLRGMVNLSSAVFLRDHCLAWMAICREEHVLWREKERERFYWPIFQHDNVNIDIHFSTKPQE